MEKVISSKTPARIFVGEAPTQILAFCSTGFSWWYSIRKHSRVTPGATIQNSSTDRGASGIDELLKMVVQSWVCFVRIGMYRYTRWQPRSTISVVSSRLSTIRRTGRPYLNIYQLSDGSRDTRWLRPGFFRRFSMSLRQNSAVFTSITSKWTSYVCKCFMTDTAWLWSHITGSN